jgi:hypothetical protein
MRRTVLLILICAALGCFCQTITKYDIKDQQALNEVAGKWERYWNSHNADSLATLLLKAEPGFKGKQQQLTITRKIMQPYLKPVFGLQTA